MLPNNTIRADSRSCVAVSLRRAALPLLVIAAGYVLTLAPVTRGAERTASRWEQHIRRFEERDRKQMPPADGFLFIGSSSIVRWDLEKHFPDRPVINRGFGGSQIADSVQFAERILIPYRPRVVVLYAGDNDIASGKSPDQVLSDYKAFVEKVRVALPETKIVFVAIKPSVKRWNLVEKMREANRRIRAVTLQEPLQEFVDIDPAMIGDDGRPKPELFASDGLHLSEQGYDVWSSLVRPHLK
jgi:lysophospholipase L1-like esterase